MSAGCCPGGEAGGAGQGGARQGSQGVSWGRGGGTADSALGQAEVWVLMVQEHKDQPTTGSERRRRRLLLYQGSAGAGGVGAADEGERALGDRGIGGLFPNPSVSGFLICETGEATPSTSV